MLGIRHRRGGIVATFSIRPCATLRRSSSRTASSFIRSVGRANIMNRRCPDCFRSKSPLSPFLLLPHLQPSFLAFSLTFRLYPADDYHDDKRHKEQGHAHRGDDDEWDGVEVTSLGVLAPSGGKGCRDVEGIGGGSVGCGVVRVRQCMMRGLQSRMVRPESCPCNLKNSPRRSPVHTMSIHYPPSSRPDYFPSSICTATPLSEPLSETTLFSPMPRPCLLVCRVR